MKKHLTILLFSLCLASVAPAQMVSQEQDNEPISIGLKGGINMPRMLYFGNKALSRLHQDWYITPTGGLFVEIPISSNLYLVPEAVYIQRGTRISYDHFSGAKVNYSISTSYVDLRLPIEWVWNIKPYFQPFATVGAEAGMCLLGQIHLKREAGNSNPAVPALDETILVDSTNMSLIHAGVYAGVGIRSKVSLGYFDILLKLSATFHQGFLDSYSPYEKNGASQALNVNAYQITGYRLPEGLEVCLGIAIPLKPILKDACASFSKDRHRRHGSQGHLFGY